MKKKFLGFIRKEPLIWFHYLPLTGVVILAYLESVLLGLMNLVKENPVKGWFFLILLYYLNLFIGDQIIHYLIKKD
jgi:hypothetical protein